MLLPLEKSRIYMQSTVAAQWVSEWERNHLDENRSDNAMQRFSLWQPSITGWDNTVRCSPDPSISISTFNLDSNTKRIKLLLLPIAYAIHMRTQTDAHVQLCHGWTEWLNILLAFLRTNWTLFTCMCVKGHNLHNAQCSSIKILSIRRASFVGESVAARHLFLFLSLSSVFSFDAFAADRMWRMQRVDRYRIDECNCTFPPKRLVNEQ